MNNININSIKKLKTPYELKNELNLTYKNRLFIDENRKIINNILNNEDNRKMIIIGPCSVHNYEQCIDYVNSHYSASDIDSPFWNYVRENYSRTYRRMCIITRRFYSLYIVTKLPLSITKRSNYVNIL